MSMDEVAQLLKASGDRDRRVWERERISWFYTLVAQSGTKEFKKPSDVFTFEWEKEPKKEPKKLTKEEVKQKVKEADKWLGIKK